MARNVEFSIDNLGLLSEGILVETFKREMAYVVRDCQDRPLDDKDRTVTIQFKVKPNLSVENGVARDCDKVDVACDISSKIPNRKSSVYEMKVHQNGKLSFHPDSAEDADADLLFDKEAEEADKKRG